MGSTFEVAFAQYEPGGVCNGLLDKDYATNERECARYYQKSSPPGTLPCQGNWVYMGTVYINNVYLRLNPRFRPRMAKAPTFRSSGTAPATNQVYVEAGGSNMIVSSYDVNATGCRQGILSGAAGGGAWGLPVLGDWDADTGW